jgi:hypothetical protein
MTMFSAHRVGSDEEDGEDEGDENDEADELADQLEQVAVGDGAYDGEGGDGSDGEEEEEEEEEEDGDQVDAESEFIKRRVQKDMKSRVKAKLRGSRNTSKLSVKGRLVHKDMW